MTWNEFVGKVNQLLEVKGLHDAELQSIAWDRDAFGGIIPDVYVNIMEDNSIIITED